MKKLLELEAKLIKARDILNKQLKGDQHKLDADKDGDIEADDLAALREKRKKLSKIMSSSTTAPGSVNTTGGPSIASQIGFGKKDQEEKMEEIAEEEIKEHEEEKHSAKGHEKEHKKIKDMKKKEQELIKFNPEGQWSIE